MSTSTTDELPVERIAKWASYLPNHLQASLRNECTDKDENDVASVLGPFFGTWRTSLMGKDIEILEEIANDRILREVVKTIVLVDDAQRVDPWSASELPSAESDTYAIWPRMKDKRIQANRFNIDRLRKLVADGKLRPEKLVLRDYRMELLNLNFCPEMNSVKHLFDPDENEGFAREACELLGKELVDGIGTVSVASIVMHHVDIPFFPDPDSPMYWPRFANGGVQVSLGSPKVTETTITMKTEQVEPGREWSKMEKASLRIGTDAEYWLHKLTREFPLLKELEIIGTNTTPMQNLVIFETGRLPQLEKVHLLHVRLPAEAILSLLSRSTDSLRELHLSQVTLTSSVNWSTLFAASGEKFRALNHLKLAFLRHGPTSSSAVDWMDLKEREKDLDLHGQFELVEKGRPENKRVTKMSYTGDDAMAVLKILSEVGK